MSKKATRFYWTPIFSSCSYNCVYCDAIGACTQSTKGPDDVTRSINKAEIAKYDGLLLPCNVMPLIDQTPEQLLDKQNTCFVINTKYTSNDWDYAIQKLKNSQYKVIVIIDDFSPTLEFRLHQIDSTGVCCEYWVVLHKDLNIKRIVTSLTPAQQEQVRFYPPMSDKDDALFLSTAELYRLGRELNEISSHTLFIPPSFVELYQPYINDDLELEPLPNVKKINSVIKDVMLSIVIPSYNSGMYLEHCIKHLLHQQALETQAYEILIVDDGSDDGSIDACVQSLLPEVDTQITVLGLQRVKPRVPGDSAFRAGVARNVGARYARGEYIAFIDADILVSPNFVNKLLISLQDADIVQAQRHYLTYDASKVLPQYDEISGDDCYIADNGYWHDFYERGLKYEWNNLEHAYKYTCSYCFAMSIELFKGHGGFRKTFAFYGFEDTELGYRLYKDNNLFYLLDEIVYHLEPNISRSEYSKNETIRNELLRHSARWFYHLTLDDRVYEHFDGMM
jgi:glycosyltransferase involved in cell wall biosynthesis